jgi:hypothetical protein
VARARYDELLAVGKRWTVEAIRNPGWDAAAVAAGWQAVHRAARHHFGWLGQPLRALPGPRLEVDPDVALQRVADAIGAAGDLLALHAETTAALREDPAATADARRNLAVLVSRAAYAAGSALGTPAGRTAPEVVAVRRQLDARVSTSPA